MKKGKPKGQSPKSSKKIPPGSNSGRLPPLRKASQAELMAAEDRLYRGFVESVTSDTPDYADFGGQGNGSAGKIGHNGFVNENPLQKYDNLVTKVLTLETWIEFLAQKQKILDQNLAYLTQRLGPTLKPERGIR